MAAMVFVGWVSGVPRNPPVVSMRPQSGRKLIDRRVTAWGLTRSTFWMERLNGA